MADVADRLKAAIFALVRSALPRVDYYAQYACTVASQNADGTLELTPDSPKLPGLSNIKYKADAGVQVSVNGGCRCLVGWENGDPSKPYACGFDNGVGTLSKHSITAAEVDIGGNSQQAPMFNTYRTAQATLDTAAQTLATSLAVFDTAVNAFSAAVNTYVTAIQGVADPGNAATPAMKTAATTMATAATTASTAATVFGTAVGTFEGAAATYLSTIAKNG